MRRFLQGGDAADGKREDILFGLDVVGLKAKCVGNACAVYKSMVSGTYAYLELDKCRGRMRDPARHVERGCLLHDSGNI
jgi:hypothetical protein